MSARFSPSQSAGDAAIAVHSDGVGSGSGSGVGIVPLSSLQATKQNDNTQNKKKERSFIVFISLDFQIIMIQR
jgi:hypothetical protein